MRQPALAIAALASFAAVASVHAAPDYPADRQAMMKNNGAATGAAAAMVKGEAPFDARVAALSVHVMNTAANGFGAMFPEGSESGAETEAKPEIWSDREGFEAALEKFRADTAAYLQNPAGDLDSFKVAFGEITKNCGACHEKYRVQKN